MLSKPSLFPVGLPVEEETINRRGILVYNICLISISDLVSDELQINQFRILKERSTINSANEYEPDVLNPFCAKQV